MKQKIKDYWENKTCETDKATSIPFTKNYHDQIEDYRYSMTPEVFEFAQFTRYSGKKVLEVGVGAGTDFCQWVKAGCIITGIDLTSEAVKNTASKLASQNLSGYDLRVADAENLPFKDETFDLVYSWGVIHHTANMQKALEEVCRVTKRNGEIKLMLYNSGSVLAYLAWLKVNILKLQFPKSIKACFYNGYFESVGTKVHSKKEFKKIFSKLPVKIESINSRVCGYDLLQGQEGILGSRFFKSIAYTMACLFGYSSSGFFSRITLRRV